MHSRFKAILTLVLIAPVLTEIVSGNTPPHALLRPRIDLFLIAVYSLPLLVIRETAIRCRLGTAGVFLLGLAYGLLNEGLIAQTLIRYQRVPMPNFDGYLCASGINFSWAALILPWHALMAVIFPIALLGFWFPSCAQSTWLGKRAFAVLALVVAGGSAFLGLVRTPHFQMRISLLTMAALVACAGLFRGEHLPAIRMEMRKWTAFAIGGTFYIAMFGGANVLASRKVPAELYLAAVTLLFAALGWIARRFEFERLPDSAMVALGAYFAASLFNGLRGVVRHSPEAVVCGTILSLAFLYVWRVSRVERTNAPSLASQPET
jgi:hypothetical protein